jgi:antiviral helicase SKI2
MLYKGADLIRDVEFVIFDEVHYVNDAEVCTSHLFDEATQVIVREVLYGKRLSSCFRIMSTSFSCRRLFQTPRSLQIGLGEPNISVRDLADLCRRTKKKDIYVISTAQRPVPLEHYLYAGRETYKIVDSNRNFLSQG